MAASAPTSPLGHNGKSDRRFRGLMSRSPERSVGEVKKKSAKTIGRTKILDVLDVIIDGLLCVVVLLSNLPPLDDVPVPAPLYE